MKILFYNIAYGTGINGSWKQYLNNVWRFVWTPFSALKKIGNMLEEEKVDVICLAEIDRGSFRNRFRSQIKALAKRLGYPHAHSARKYHPRTVWRWLTILSHQHDAVISRHEGEFMTHYFKIGIQRAYLEFVVDGISIFVVHLAVVRKGVRRKQLLELAEKLQECPRPYVLCGDFNVHNGLHEMDEILQKTGAILVETDMTFPSFKPRVHIDLFLVSPDLHVKKAGVVNVHFSDHLPVWAEIEKKKT